MIKNTFKGKQLGLIQLGWEVQKGPGGTFGATRTFSTAEAATKTN
jgi:hypothetical protein